MILQDLLEKKKIVDQESFLHQRVILQKKKQVINCKELSQKPTNECVLINTAHFP